MNAPTATPTLGTLMPHRTGHRWIAGQILGAVVLSLLLTAPIATNVLHGGFGDPDDAMRLVEVRAWLGGQGWFDLTAHRLDPPLGASMHWSRLVDLPMAFFIRLFGLVVDRARAEGLAAVVVPTLYLAALYAGMARLGDVLLGRASCGPAVLGMLASGVTLVQFQPGRIGHHAPETVALVFAVAYALASFDPARARQAGLAGVLIALSLAMSLETLPFLGLLCAIMVAAWVIRGEGMASALGWFATGLGLALPIVFLATVGPDHWGAPVCDAYGAPQAGAGLIGAGGAFLLARAMPSSWPMRLGAATGVGALILAFVMLAYPNCLHSPFAGVDPLVRAIWLDNVVESKPLPGFMQRLPMTGLAIVIPLALGLAASLWAVVASRGTTRLRFAAIALFATFGLALGFWQVRVFASVAPIALCGGLFVVDIARKRLASRGLALAAMFAAALILAFTATGWAILLPGDVGPGGDGGACLSRRSLAPLATLAPGRAVAPVDAGAHLLEMTALDVFAAPYHRDNDGNRFALDVFLADPPHAATMLASRHVAYVVTCPGFGETASLAERAPKSLAADLMTGRMPTFLRPVPLSGTPYRVFAVVPGGS